LRKEREELEICRQELEKKYMERRKLNQSVRGIWEKNFYPLIECVT
jgi:hypothetical protein